MTSRYLNENLEYTDNLSRPGTALGSVLASDINGDFIPTAPTDNFQVLTADSAQAAGVEWKASITNTGLAFAQNALSAGGIRYFIVDVSVDPVPLVLPDSKAVFLGINCKDSVNGWSSVANNFSSGSYDLTVGFVPANSINIPANWTAYPGGPHLSVPFSSINSNNFTSLTAAPNFTISAGQQVSIRKVNNLNSINPATFGTLNVFFLCVGI